MRNTVNIDIGIYINSIEINYAIKRWFSLIMATQICYNSKERNLYFVSDETGDTLEGI